LPPVLMTANIVLSRVPPEPTHEPLRGRLLCSGP
jgi:hypothetical protein